MPHEHGPSDNHNHLPDGYPSPAFSPAPSPKPRRGGERIPRLLAPAAVLASLIALAAGSLVAQDGERSGPGRHPHNTTRPVRRITLDDILSFDRLTDVSIAPDGRSVVYVTLKPGPNSVYGERPTIWLLDLASMKVRKLVAPVSDKDLKVFLWPTPQPQWSPDGRQIAYLSGQSGHTEIWLVDTATGQQQQLTRLDTLPADTLHDPGGNVREFVFSPTGNEVAYVRTFSDAARQQDLERRKVIAVSEQPHFLSFEGIDGTFAHVSVISILSLKTGQTRRLTAPLTSATALQWSPDGSRLLFMPLGDTWYGNRPRQADPTVLTIASGEMNALANTWEADWSPTWSPRGDAICYLSVNRDSPGRLSRSLFVASVDGTKAHRISDDSTSIPYRLPILWARTNTIYAGVRSHGTIRLYGFAPDGSGRSPVTPEHMHVRAYSLSADGRRLAAVFENANTPPEVYLGDPLIGTFEKLTNLGSALRGIELGAVETVTWRSGDDRFDVEGFLVKPPDFTVDRKYPLLVNMHGGPAALYENGFSEINFTSGYHTPAQLYAANGYLVLLPNKRGDESYGAAFLSAQMQHWGDDVMYDMLPGVDALIARGLVDTARIGVMGHSYGGYATAWAISHSNRFKAAAISDGFVNLLSYFRQIHDTWQEPFMGGSPTVAQRAYLEQSPIVCVRNIRTPTLLRYGRAQFPRGGSFGMPLQGMELFAALRERGVPVEFLYHPTQGHVVADEEVYRDWVARNLRWFGYWVLGQGRKPLVYDTLGTEPLSRIPATVKLAGGTPSCL